MRLEEAGTDWRRLEETRGDWNRLEEVRKKDLAEGGWRWLDEIGGWQEEAGWRRLAAVGWRMVAK